MQRLFVLIVVVTAVRGFSSHVNVDHVHDHDYPYGLGLTAPPEQAARETAVGSVELRVTADANDLRMDDLQAQLDQLQAQLDKTSNEEVTIWPWLSFIYLRLGNGCDKGRFQCASWTDQVPQCVSGLAVCDGIADCKDGNDEHPSICRNHVPLGSNWVGDLDWVGCAAHRSTRLSVVITRAWKDALLPSVQKIAATLVFTWVEGGRTRTNTEQAEGRYNFASHAFQLKADPGGHVSADITCSFTDDKHCHAVIFQASTNTLCGRVILSRT